MVKIKREPFETYDYVNCKNVAEYLAQYNTKPFPYLV